MNWNFMMAGTASTNPVLLVVALGLIMAWKVSGYIGADFFLLPKIGTPWSVKDDDIGVAKMSDSTSRNDKQIKN